MLTLACAHVITFDLNSAVGSLFLGCVLVETVERSLPSI